MVVISLIGSTRERPNNSGVTPSARVLTAVSVAQFGILAGAPIFNPQTGLFEEQVMVTNNAAVTILGFRLYVGDAAERVRTRCGIV